MTTLPTAGGASTGREPGAGRGPGAIQTLHPAYFALVMATGIVAIAAHLRGFPWIARPFFWLNIPFYFILIALTIVRFFRFRPAFLADLSDHGRSVGFFTAVAATGVLASGCLTIYVLPSVAFALWVGGIVLWIVVTYTIFTLLTVKTNKPTLERGINGGWLVAIVATQSVSVVASQLSPQFTAGREVALFYALVMWLGGGMLYIWMISLIFYRYTFFQFLASDLAPPYWINMGAVAISTLAGTWLISRAQDSAFLHDLLPFIKGFTLLFWATASGWIPMLLILGVWRHGFQRFPLTYDPLYWGAVFPLGMYTVCTHRMSAVLDLPFLDVIPRIGLFVALFVWILTFVGMVRRVAGAMMPRRSTALSL